MDLYAVLVELSTYGIVAVHTPYASISAHTYILPPPTTLVGALAYSYKRAQSDYRELDANGYSPAIELVDKRQVLYAAAGIATPPSLTRTVERVYHHTYLRKEYRKTLPPYTVGSRSIVAVDKMYILYIVSDRDIARYCCGIVRLGRKESLVAVDSITVAQVGDAVVEGRTCETTFYFPRSIVQNYSPSDVWIEVEMPTLYRENFIKKTLTTEVYIVPKPFIGIGATVALNRNGVVLSVRTSDQKEISIPVPREVVGM